MFSFCIEEILLLQISVSWNRWNFDSIILKLNDESYFSTYF